jgi:23S rRNA-/tRNA-specific pseudouridylate synthase
VLADDAALAGPTSEVDAVVVNPPRRGLAPRTRERLALARPLAVAYVSCSPDTLARDLAAFALLGYGVSSITPFDMIPLSEHVETLALLVPRTPPAPRVLKETGELLIVDKPPHEPVTGVGRAELGLTARVRLLPGWESAELLVGLDPESSGPCVFVKSPELLSRWCVAPTLEGVRRRFVGLARGVTRAKGSVNRGPDGARVRTRYRRAEVAGGHSLLHLEAPGGDERDLARHLASLGHAIVGDGVGGHRGTNRHFEEKYGVDRRLLHLEALTLRRPGTDEGLEVSSPLPGDFIAVLKRLRARATGAADAPDDPGF